jgi:polyferredoxin
MKFERERDIVAFKGKNWREKWVLRNQAEDRDPWILRLKMLKYFFVLTPILALSWWLAYQFFPHSRLLAAIAIGITLGCPIDMALYSLFIVPRIRKALDFTMQPAA